MAAGVVHREISSRKAKKYSRRETYSILVEVYPSVMFYSYEGI
jgi:hypothetical protein